MGGTLTCGRVVSCGAGEYCSLMWGCGKRVSGWGGRLGTLLGPEGTSTSLLSGGGPRCGMRLIRGVVASNGPDRDAGVVVVWVRGGSGGMSPSVL
jgi:hypothetical protein